jgi:hypothetical protein
MKRQTIFVALILMGCFFSITLGQSSKGDSSSLSKDVMDRPVSAKSFKDLTTANAFREALSAAGVPGGIVKVSRCDEDLTLQNWGRLGSSLRDVLDAIVKVDDQYRWQLEDGVVNLLPADDQPALLQVRVKHLLVKNATSVYQAYSKLFALPEVKKAIADLKLNDSFERIQGGLSGNLNQTQFSVDRKSITLREALNAIVRAQGQAVWSYKEYHCNGAHGLSIEFIVQ